jgi:hypothetical protein
MASRTVLWLTILAFCGSARADDATLTPAVVAKIERAVTLPSTASAMDGYDRYYAPTTYSNRPMIVGLFLATSIANEREPRKGRFRIVSSEADLPGGISDGGCLEIHVYWDIATEKIAGVFCNGLA